MNNYPIWWDTTITIYNKFEDNQTSLIKWYRQVIPNCFWKAEGNKITIGNTTLETDNTICRIPENEKFLDKYLWITKPNDLMGNFFTFKNIMLYSFTLNNIIHSFKPQSNILFFYYLTNGLYELRTFLTLMTGEEQHILQ